MTNPTTVGMATTFGEQPIAIVAVPANARDVSLVTDDGTTVTATIAILPPEFGADRAVAVAVLGRAAVGSVVVDGRSLAVPEMCDLSGWFMYEPGDSGTISCEPDSGP